MSHNSNGTRVERVEKATILALAEDITQKTKDITEYLQANGYDQPTDSATSSRYPDTVEYAVLYGKLKRCLEDLNYLVEGPKRHFRELCCQGYELAAIQVALEFGFFEIVPLEGQISIEALAEKAGVDFDRTCRIVRLLVTEFIFQEPVPGVIAHNPSSYLLHVDEEIRSTLHYTLDEMLKAASATADNVKASPLEYDSALTPFATLHGIPIFKFYEKDTQRSIRFAKAMAGWAKLNLNINALKEAFPWDELKGTVVDVGGGSGKVSITLAQSFPGLKFIVQDSVDMHAAGQALLTDETRDRVSFMQHSFFDPQPVGGAAAFILRACALNWSDRDVVTMFRSLVPGLERSESTTPLLINDLVLPPQGTLTRDFERGLRQIDLIMLVGFGGKLRTQSEFAALLKEADERYEIRNFYPEGLMGLLEVYLQR
ncbi:S-adenosyl-L-methionine-dependent methyltransferase [Penicillium cinerascens]|uniref:S-adenosyl-L-methionine-dependent methyltransferase n=1 Tax=Penicillium cinerascens TaxID=70096 RepID=A0A9W9SX84_9EURO|nr:S-adenosyl-L-methionine-dependent methyltransferase [Penicillium cinerascens]KAJ5201516.1 S-adenosyl-L-methionine-dependent methyltransferase [Penicillium cinerascens]